MELWNNYNIVRPPIEKGISRIPFQDNFQTNQRSRKCISPDGCPPCEGIYRESEPCYESCWSKLHYIAIKNNSFVKFTSAGLKFEVQMCTWSLTNSLRQKYIYLHARILNWWTWNLFYKKLCLENRLTVSSLWACYQSYIVANFFAIFESNFRREHN